MVGFVLPTVSSKLDLSWISSSADYLTEELVAINRDVGRSHGVRRLIVTRVNYVALGIRSGTDP